MRFLYERAFARPLHIFRKDRKEIPGGVEIIEITGRVINIKMRVRDARRMREAACVSRVYLSARV